MKPYGRRKKMVRNLPDFHPQKGWVNWWEKLFNDVNKKRDRRKSKENIKKELNGL